MTPTKTLIVVASILLMFSLITAAAKVEGMEVIATTAKVEGMDVIARTAKGKGMEDCVMLFFNRDSRKNISNRENYIWCKDKLREVGIHYKLFGVLSQEYVEALRKVPKFKNDEASSNRFLDRLSLTYRGEHRRN